MQAAVMASRNWDDWHAAAFSRRIETLGSNDMPTYATGPKAELDNIWYIAKLFSHSFHGYMRYTYTDFEILLVCQAN